MAAPTTRSTPRWATISMRPRSEPMAWLELSRCTCSSTSRCTMPACTSPTPCTARRGRVLCRRSPFTDRAPRRATSRVPRNRHRLHHRTAAVGAHPQPRMPIPRPGVGVCRPAGTRCHHHRPYRTPCRPCPPWMAPTADTLRPSCWAGRTVHRELDLRRWLRTASRTPTTWLWRSWTTHSTTWEWGATSWTPLATCRPRLQCPIRFVTH